MNADINAHCESGFFVDLVIWLGVGLVGLALLGYLLDALIHPEKW